MQIVDDDRVINFVGNALSVALCPPMTCMGIEKDGEIIAGVIFNVFEGDDVHFSCAGKGWTRRFYKEVGRYVFDALGCERMTAITENPEVVRLAERLGGQIEGLMRNHFGKGRDAYVVGILREDYRFG